MPIRQGTSREPWLLGLLVILGIFFLLFGFGSTPASGNLVAPPLDKVVHLGIFATLAISLRVTLPTLPLFLIGGLALGIGAVDEFHQYFVPTRQPALDDLLADAFGVFGGLWGWHRLAMKRACRA